MSGKATPTWAVDQVALKEALQELWTYAQGLEGIIRNGVYRSEELKDPDAWNACDDWAYNGEGASIRDQVEAALSAAGKEGETSVPALIPSAAEIAAIIRLHHATVYGEDGSWAGTVSHHGDDLAAKEIIALLTGGKNA